ncbi:MAG: hypothetical protein ACLT5P_05815 [Flavonifractor plautii]
MILDYDKLCRAAIQGRRHRRAVRHPLPGADGPGQERAGDRYAAVYADIARRWAEIDACAEKGGLDV